MTTDEIQVYEPAKGEDYSFGPMPDGSFLSSVAEQALVVSIPPRLGLISDRNNSQIDVILSRFELNQGFGFVCGYTIPEEKENQFPKDAIINGQGIFGYFPATKDNFRHYLSLFESLEYGELTVGCINRKIVDLKSFISQGNGKEYLFKDFDLLTILSHLKEVDWLVSLYADTGHGLFISRKEYLANQFLQQA